MLLKLEPVRPGTPTAQRWAFYLHRYHYLGLQVVGENLGCLAQNVQGRAVACLLFGAPAWRCAPRDRALGWSDCVRRQELPTLSTKTGLPLTNTRWRDLQLETVAGLVKLRVRHGWSQALNRSVCPARQAWGLDAYQRTRPELQARLTYTATEVPSYERAARMAQTWGTPVSDTWIHFQVQRLGAAAATIPLPTPSPLPRDPQFSLVVRMDGWIVRERGRTGGPAPQAEPGAHRLS